MRRRKNRYPKNDYLKKGYLDVGDGHNLYYEVSGNPHGHPVVFLHGGPGGGCSFKEHDYFDPEYYQIILFDQRGAGRSTPYAHIDFNSPEYLIEDLEKLRNHLDIEKWALAGGSWGSCLAMLYTIQFPHRVQRLLLRGLFFGDLKGAQHIIEEWGAAEIQPEYFEQYASAPFVPQNARHNLTRMYHDVFEYGDEETQMDAALRFNLWDTSIAYAQINKKALMKVDRAPKKSLALAKLFFHYTMNSFAVNDYKSRIFAAADIFDALSIDVVHGECDWICPVQNAHEFKRLCPHANINIILAGGHTMGDPLIRDAFVETLKLWSEE